MHKDHRAKQLPRFAETDRLYIVYINFRFVSLSQDGLNTKVWYKLIVEHKGVHLV